MAELSFLRWSSVTACLLAGLLAASVASARPESPWPNGAEVAVVLTYDDALDSHLDVAIPQLNRFALPGTFYLSGARPSMRTRLDDWRRAAAQGHELGNHTLYHPCRKSVANRDWVKSWQDLDRYTLDQFVEEVKTTNSMLQAIDGEKQRTFAYPCGDMQAGDEDVVPALKELVTGARLFSDDGQHLPHDRDFYRVASFDGAEKSGEQLIAVAEAARKNHSLVGFLFHGVGGDYITVSADAHQQLLEHLAAHPDRYWVATMREAVAHLRKAQAHPD